MEEPLIDFSIKDIESQEEFEREFYLNERRERHKDDLACIGLMLIFVFVHIMTQVFTD
jgi:hypothetical protein